MENKKLKIGILGLGLIGGSILKGLYQNEKYELKACSVSSYKAAQKYAESSFDIEILKDCEVIFVCSKMCDMKKNLSQLNNFVSDNCIVCDVSSVKGFLNEKYNFDFIKTHPMAGIEKFGFEASFKDLFKGAKWIIEKENPLIIGIIEDLGAKPVIMDSNLQDESAAYISHLPTLLSLCLFDIAPSDARKIAASGFRDMTRLSMGDYNLSCDMLKFNRENIEKAYGALLKDFEKIKNMDEEEFKNFASNIARLRKLMYDENGKNIL